MAVNLEKVAQLVRLVDTLKNIRSLPDEVTEEQIEELLENAITVSGADVSIDEITAAKRDLTWMYKVYTTPGQSIVDDYDQAKWYDDIKAEIIPTFWTRYKNYLIDIKKFSPNVVSTLGEDTLDQKLMNCLGNPNSNQQFLKRGLIIGDVQSGKTSTYIGLMCKAADAGYKVFILLTGTVESLRRQTQERVEEGFIGINMAADSTGGQRVGVGLDNQPIRAMGLTSRVADFTGNADKIAVSLADKNAVVFVIKKNATVLQKITDWLTSDLNADPVSKMIDLPLIIIDDEADNASVNTSANKDDPTTINRAIRKLASVFTRSNYIGFTATPFANVFIDPETTDVMENQDLFPEDFIVALPTPSNYIGATKIFPEDGPFHSQLQFIEDAGREEDDGWPFYFKHKKDWDDFLPNSLTDALYTFYLANAIRDLRGDNTAHRSMLINISRFVKVQKRIKEQVEQLHSRAYRAIKFNLSLDFESSMKDPILKRIYKNWQKQYSNTEFSWDDIANQLFSSIENIQIKVVNSSKSSEKLIYPDKESLRVIAIGGLALSRGLTLEGLITSYFYRNTCTYDVLMQMGRWFGYRKNYEDLFRIWTHEDSAEWYAEIAEATETLKDDMSLMRELELKPKNFGIRVRNNCSELRITAANKMRNATDEIEYDSYFGSVIETPYVIYDSDVQKNNYLSFMNWVNTCLEKGRDVLPDKVKGAGSHHTIYGISKFEILQMIRQLKISRFNSNFDVSQICSFLGNCTDSSLDYWNVAFMDGAKNDDVNQQVIIQGKSIYKVQRKNCIFDTESKRLSIGRRGKMGGPNDGLLGIEPMNGMTAEEIIEKAKADYKADYKKANFKDMPSDRAFASDTWFKYISNRHPLLIVYFVDVDEKQDTPSEKAKKFREEMNGMPVVCFAMGFPRNDNAALIGRTRYKANKVYNWFECEEILAESQEEE